MPQLASELGMTMSFFNGAENRYIEGWNLFCAGVIVAAGGAGTTPTILVRNPVGSNVIGVFELITLSSLAAGQDWRLVIQNSLPQPADLGPNLGRPRGDFRSQPTGTSSLSSLFCSAAASAVILGGGSQQWTAVGPWSVIQNDLAEIPLTPGGWLSIQNGTLVTDGRFALMWRERALEDSEFK
jgi:hypothetical protein